MPSRIRIDHSISGPELDALRAGTTAPREPTYAPAPSPGSVNAYVARVATGRVAALLTATGVLLLVVALAARGVTTGRATAGAAVASPVASVAVATETPSAIYARAPSLSLWCDGTPRELVSASQSAAAWQAGCVAAYGWCSECQIAWQQAHP